MINASEAIRIVLESTKVLGTEKVSLLSALGRTLGRDIVAETDLPQFNNSSMDGFAVAASSLKHATKRHPCIQSIVGESRAGKPFTGRVAAGQAVRIMTGAMVPKGTNAVVPVERATELDRLRVQFAEHVKSGQHIRKIGEDIERGEIVLKKGRVITSGSLAVLAALGYTRVEVYRKPRANILATGDELVEIDRRPAKGRIRNSSSYALAGFVSDAGGEVNLFGIASDTRKRLRQKLERGLDGADLLLVTGGVSVGRYDLVKDVLSHLGVEIRFWKVNIKPGKPLLFGKWKNTLVFGLPGNPVSTAVTFLQFVKPALLRMSGRTDVLPVRYSAVLDHRIAKLDDLRHYVRGIAVQRNGRMHVSLTGTQSSGAMSSMSKANCLMIVPEKKRTIRRGEMIDIEFL